MAFFPHLVKEFHLRMGQEQNNEKKKKEAAQHGADSGGGESPVCLSFLIFCYSLLLPVFLANYQSHVLYKQTSSSFLVRYQTTNHFFCGSQTPGNSVLVWVREAGLVELRRAGRAKYGTQTRTTRTKKKNFFTNRLDAKTSSHAHADNKRAEGMQ